MLLEGDRCGSEHRELRHLGQLIAPWHYAGTGGALVRRFKLDGDAAAGRFVARAMANAWLARADPEWRRAVLVPVPLHASRRRERGFDQAAWLAERLGAALRLRAAIGALARPFATLPQGDPRVLSRERNVADAFVLRDARGVVGRAVVLVDDVFTSGATGRRCAELLLAGGAREVAMLTACRS